MQKGAPPKKPTPEDFGMTDPGYQEAKATLKSTSSIDDRFSRWWIVAFVLLGLCLWLDWAVGAPLFMVCVGVAWIADYVNNRASQRGETRRKNHLLQKIRPYEEAISAYQQDLARYNLAQEHCWKSLRGAEFERQLATLYRKLNYTVTLTKATGDEGIDLLLRKDGQSTIVQCKGHHKPVGVGAVRDLYGTLMHCRADRAVLACPAGFTEGVKDFVKGKPIDLISAPELVAMAEQAEREPSPVIATTTA